MSPRGSAGWDDGDETDVAGSLKQEGKCASNKIGMLHLHRCYFLTSSEKFFTDKRKKLADILFHMQHD